MKKIFPFLLLLVSISLKSQIDASTQKEVLLTEIMEKAIFSDDSVVEYRNIRVTEFEDATSAYFIGPWVYDYLVEKHPDIDLDSSNRIIVKNSLILRSVSGSFNLSGFAFEKEVVLGGRKSRPELDSDLFPSQIAVTLLDCSFKDFQISTERNTNFFDIDIKGSAYLNFDGIEVIDGGPQIILNKIHFRDTTYGFINASNYEVLSMDGIENENGPLKVTMKNGELTYLSRSEFQNEVTISGSTFDLQIVDNSFKSQIDINSAEITERIKIRRNEFLNKLGISQTLLPEFFIDIHWDQLSNHNIFTKVDAQADETPEGFGCFACLKYEGESEAELANSVRFHQLIAVYTRLYRNYKEIGNITSANESYSELQQLYTRRYGYLHNSEGGIKNWFKWRLNQLLEFYVDYGTDPARALVISFYIIICFAAFYFFFPSEWDVASKEKLIANIKSAVNKKEDGTGKSVLKSILLLILSFINAITLSLNAFVTLGFGTIPTRGLARYVCVIQGFIGWFLLSLFSVALINQVIF